MHNKLSIPNKISIFRIALIPVFIALTLQYRRVAFGYGEWLRYAAIVVFGLAMASDVLDGYIARKYRMRSELGSFLDPLADKLLLNSAVIVMCLRPIGPGFPAFGFPIWYAVVVFSRDLILGLGYLTVYLSIQLSLKIHPVSAGKLATILNMCAVTWALLDLDGAYIFYYPGGLCTFIAGVQYIYSGFRQVNESGQNHTVQRDSKIKDPEG